MFKDIDGFLRYYDGLQRRTIRDISALPAAEADAYRPETGEGENAWPIGELVRHIGGARLYFARAYRDEGWIFDGPARDVKSPTDWLPVLEETYAEFRSRLEGTPVDWLERRIQMIDTDNSLAGWRILMMCLEHEVHHRSQIDTYAGLNKWDVPHIYGRSAEQVGAERENQRAQHGG